MVVYLDIILLLNFLIDTLLLWFTAYFRKERIIWWRMLLAAAFGASYVVFFFLPSFAGMYQGVVKFLFSVLMLVIAFGFRRWLHLAQTLCIFYFVAFVFGGGVFALQYLMAEQSEIVNGILLTHNDSYGVGSKPTLMILVSGFLVVFWLSKKSYQSIQEPRRLEAFLVEITLRLRGETVICRGLVDTGNHLYDPLTRTPVMVMESKLLAHLLPQSLLAHLQLEQQQKWDGLDLLFASLPPEWQTRVKLIPFRSVKQELDFLLAFKPDLIIIKQGGVLVHCRKVLVGISPQALSPDAKYQAIVHPALLQETVEDTMNL